MEISNQHISLRLDEQGRVRLSTAQGDEWSSPGPLFILHYYDRQHPRAQIVSVPSGEGYVFGTAGTPSLSAKGELKEVRLDGQALSLTASFANIQIRIGVVIRLNDSGVGFSLRIDEQSVEEGMPSLYRILGIELLPEFGAAKTGESGYLTLPNWSGCQTFYDKSYPREVWQTVYSSNDQWEYACNMGFYGITREQGTLCAMISEGDCDAQWVCRVHWEQAHSNSVHPYLVYRWEQQDELLPGPREMRYSFAPADYEGGEGYVFCAKEYRSFLREYRGLQSWDEKAVSRPEVLDYRDRFFLKIFMAYKEPQADGHGKYHAVTTFDETRQIIEKCLERGMRKLMVVLVGWGRDGHDGMPPTRFPVDERLGGEEKFRDLIAWCKERDVLPVVHDSYGACYTCSPEFDTDELIRHRTGEYWESIIWSGGQAHVCCPKVFVDKYVKRDVPNIRALGIHGHHHIDAVGSFVPCYAKDHPLERRADYMEEIRRMFRFINEQMGSVSTEMPFAPYFSVVDGFFHSYTKPSSWHRASAIARYFLDRSIPLVPIVVHGSINSFESVDKYGQQPLAWLDWGLLPEWEVSARKAQQFGIGTYADSEETLMHIYNLYYGGDEALARSLSSAWIEGRWDLPGGGSRTLYSNGCTVTITQDGVAENGQVRQTYKFEKPLCTQNS